MRRAERQERSLSAVLRVAVVFGASLVGLFHTPGLTAETQTRKQTIDTCENLTHPQ
jgi:hypothetical protein